MFNCQFKGDHLHLPCAQYMRPGPDLRLVRFAGRVPALERPQKTETPRRTDGSYALQFERHVGLIG